MVKATGAALVLSLLGTSAFSQEPPSQIPQSREQGADGGVAAAAVPARDCIARSIAITNNRHTWILNATNNCGDHAWYCNFTWAMTVMGEPNMAIQCGGTVPLGGPHQTCTQTWSNKTFTGNTGVNYKCE